MTYSRHMPVAPPTICGGLAIELCRVVAVGWNASVRGVVVGGVGVGRGAAAVEIGVGVIQPTPALARRSTRCRCR